MNQASVLEMLCFVQVVSPFPIPLFPLQICFVPLPQQCCVEEAAPHPDEKRLLSRSRFSPCGQLTLLGLRS